MKTVIVTGSVLLGVVCFAANHWQAAAQEQPDYAELMAKYGTPGPEHKLLQFAVGKWKAVAKFYMPGQKKPLVTEGTSIREWSLGKRFVVETYTSKIMGMEFVGKGTTGFDRFTKKYVGTWMDNMSTHIICMEGSYDKKSKTFTFTYTTDDPIFGKNTRARDTVKILNENEHVLEMFYQSAKGGDEFRLMEIRYTRVSGKNAKGK